MEYDLDEAKRYIRRSRGLPSTEDISTLSYMLSEIKYMVQRQLRMPVHNIVLSLPYMPNFHRDDLNEALDLADLTHLKSYKHWSELRNINAAWAGMGLGICKHWQDIEKCDEETSHFKYKLTLVLTYTYDELVVEVITVFHAHLAYQYKRVRYPDLSYASWDNNRSNTTYWDNLGRKVVEVFRDINEPIEELVLMGEYAEERRFLDAIRKALGNDLDAQKLKPMLQNPKFNAEFIAARGAAERKNPLPSLLPTASCLHQVLALCQN
jgi:hypothetical protein